MTSLEAVRDCLRRIAARDGRLRAFITLTAEAALAAAAASDARRAAGAALGPLDGVPMAVKGNIAVAGCVTTAGLGRAGTPADADAPCVAALRAAGAVLLGTLNMEEAALGAVTDNPWFGTCRNPLDEARTPGGSSGGSGAAVAAGFCAVALGTDTMGSVRVPAAYCGVYGLKPTHGLIAADGVVPLCRRLDDVGILAASLADIAPVLDGLAPGWARAAPAGPAALPRIARDAPLEPAVRAALDRAAAALGAVAIDVPGWDPPRARRAGLLLSEAEGAATFGVDAATHPPGLSGALVALLRYGAAATPDKLSRAAATLDDAAAAFEAATTGFAAVLLPTTPQRAFVQGGKVPHDQADFTAIANITGRPAISLPVWLDGEALPAGVQLIGQPGGESTVLALAARLDAALGKTGARLSRNAR